MPDRLFGGNTHMTIFNTVDFEISLKITIKMIHLPLLKTNK